jgi:hypothetical protein
MSAEDETVRSEHYVRRAQLGALVVFLALVVGAGEARAAIHGDAAAVGRVCGFDAPECIGYGFSAAGTLDVILKLDRRTVRPGGKLRLRVENLGTDEVSYSDSFTLERHEKGRWLKLPNQGPFFASLHGLSPGAAGQWQVAHITDSDIPGLYRVQKWLRVIREGHRSRVALREKFRVGL